MLNKWAKNKQLTQPEPIKTASFSSFFFFFFFCLLGPHPRHMEVPRVGVKSELQLPAYTTATLDPPQLTEMHRVRPGMEPGPMDINQAHFH